MVAYQIVVPKGGNYKKRHAVEPCLLIEGTSQRITLCGRPVSAATWRDYDGEFEVSCEHCRRTLIHRKRGN